MLAREVNGCTEDVSRRPDQHFVYLFFFARPRCTRACGQVGAKVLGDFSIDGTRMLPLEVWYPAQEPPSGTDPLVYDLRAWLPPHDAAKLPGEGLRELARVRRS
jgi:hypothetical protein